MIVTLAGHVDHGKTAIVQALTGTNTDRLKEEQERGLTIDLGFAYADLGSERIGFVDVPGHHRFIHNMIAGIASQQHALLVIAADDGIMPQTIEHVQILQLLKIQSGTIVLNKVDLVPPTRLETCHSSIEIFKRKRFLRNAKVFNVDAKSGQGVDELRSHLIATAQTFKASTTNRPFRLPIDRSFSLRGVGTVVTGTVISGEVHSGDEVYLTETESTVRVRNLNVQGLDATHARVGDRCSFNLAGAHVNTARRGTWLMSPDLAMPVKQVSVHLSVLGDFPRPVKHWSSAHVYHFTGRSETRIALLDGNALKPGFSGFADLICHDDMHFKAGDHLILRDRDLSCTLGGATVLATASGTSRRRSKRRFEFLTHLHAASESQDDGKTLRAYANYGLFDLREWARFHLGRQDSLTEITASHPFVRHGNFVMGIDLVEPIEAQLLTSLRRFHSKHAYREGMTLAEFVKDIPVDKPALLFVLDHLSARNRLRHIAGKWALIEHQIKKPSFDRDLLDRIQPMLNAPQPISLGDVAKRLKMPFHIIETAIKPMVAAQVVIQINKNRYFTPERVHELIQVATGLAVVRPFTVREFRDASGLGRNTVIDVLEYFDRQRITVRRGDVRMILPLPREAKKKRAD